MFHVEQAVLKKYYVKDVERPQVNTRFTWAEDGFYKTLKRRAAEVLKDQPHGPTVFMQAVYGVILTAWACCFAAACVSGSWRFLILSALLLHPILGIGHNSLHQGDNWMRFCLDLTLFSHHEWRVSHCLSHHSYTNLLLDFEMSALEPLIFSIATGPRNGLSFIIGLPVALCSMGGVEFMVRCGHTLMGYRKLAWENLLAVAELALLCAFNGLGKGWAMWAVMHSLGSLLLSIVALPLHHSEHVFTEGQGPISADFGEHTLRTSKDFDTHLGLVPSLLFFQLFNSHCLHHLFPAIDESRLPQLHDVFIKTCADFNMPYKVYTWRELLASTLFAWCLGRPGQGQTTSGSKKAQ